MLSLLNRCCLAFPLFSQQEKMSLVFPADGAIMEGELLRCCQKLPDVVFFISPHLFWEDSFPEHSGGSHSN